MAMVKQGLYILPFLTLCIGCRSMKNTTISSQTDSLSVTYNIDSTRHMSHQEIDTTLSKHVVTTITEVFFDDTIGTKLNKEQRKVETTGDLVSSILSIAEGRIKKIKTTKIEECSEKLGKQINNELSSGISIKSIQTELSQDKHQEVDVAPDPYRWRYIFFGLAVIALSIVTIKIWPKSIQPSMVWKWVKRVVSCIQGLFS